MVDKKNASSISSSKTFPKRRTIFLSVRKTVNIQGYFKLREAIKTLSTDLVNTNKSYPIVILKVIFLNTSRIKSYFPNKDRLNRSQRSKVVYKASCWD